MEIFNYLSIGLVSKDLIISPHGKYSFLGGSVIYSSIQASLLSWRSYIITAIGKSDVEELLGLIRKFAINTLEIQIYEGESLSFINDYDEKGHRIQRINREFSYMLKPNIEKKFDVIHLGPILNEINEEFIKKAREKSRFLVLDAQGLCRKLKDLEIHLEKINLSKESLAMLDVIKFDREEFLSSFDFDSFFKLYNENIFKILIITMSEKGSLLFKKEKIFFAPSMKPKKLVDPTGAGDVFLTAFSIEYFKRRNIERALSFATAASCLSLEGIAYSCLADNDKIEDKIEENDFQIQELNEKDLKKILINGPARI